MTIVNLTPHTISLANTEGEILATYPASGSVARITTSQEVVGKVDGAAIKRTVFGEITGLPDPKDNVFLLVGTMVAQAARRPDVISPDTGPTAVRENGQVVAVKEFQTF